ncbi:phosphonoacetaldehyde hydrolase [Natronocella acetinitrilica]|uniref:Phosphonoacetaldehyde hydrolase n=1 Tax=Natronocella acetinitrilica TaxID=414046 RepID=A0AAE3KC40_9GAMM|nr:phosphonoacetaldehyde hydrolase [Natronocella acetinitrilica]MCP1676445.1 phosphonoacetaldehyde hydrolase [Natronocella acetinitrilica]
MTADNSDVRRNGKSTQDPEEAIHAVIFDWAGTMVDFGSRAPMAVFVDVFQRYGVSISVDEARGPMGMPKWNHIRTLLAQPRIAAAWEDARGTPADDAAADRIYETFVPANRDVAANYADLIPGVADVVADLRRRGIAIGSTTGYTRDILERVIPVAAAQGYTPDCSVCAEETREGRPGPLMIYRCLEELAAYPAWHCVKVDDTRPGISEGLLAGCWTVGVSLSGNGVGLSLEEIGETDAAAVEVLNARSRKELQEAGAHYVIDTVADLPACLEAIRVRLMHGERP